MVEYTYVSCEERPTYKKVKLSFYQAMADYTYVSCEVRYTYKNIKLFP
jgi:hypothetical protein